MYAWTLHNENLGTEGWQSPPDLVATLHFAIEVHPRSPTGWYFTIPVDLRSKQWLPSAGGIVMFEFTDSEANFWTEAAYNEESILESEAG